MAVKRDRRNFNDSGNYVHLKEYIEKVIELQFRSAEQALILNRQELERRLEGLNELRSDVVKDRSQFVRVETYDAKHNAIETVLRNLDKRQTIVETRSVTWSAAIVIFFIIAEVLLRIFY